MYLKSGYKKTQNMLLFSKTDNFPRNQICLETGMVELTHSVFNREIYDAIGV